MDRRLIMIEIVKSRSRAHKWLRFWQQWHATGIVPDHEVAVSAIAKHVSLKLQARAKLQLPTEEREALQRKARALQAVADRPDRWAGFELPLR